MKHLTHQFSMLSLVICIILLTIVNKLLLHLNFKSYFCRKGNIHWHLHTFTSVALIYSTKSYSSFKISVSFIFLFMWANIEHVINDYILLTTILLQSNHFPRVSLFLKSGICYQFIYTWLYSCTSTCASEYFIPQKKWRFCKTCCLRMLHISEDVWVVGNDRFYIVEFIISNEMIFVPVDIRMAWGYLMLTAI